MSFEATRARVSDGVAIVHRRYVVGDVGTKYYAVISVSDARALRDQLVAVLEEIDADDMEHLVKCRSPIGHDEGGF